MLFSYIYNININKQRMFVLTEVIGSNYSSLHQNYNIKNRPVQQTRWPIPTGLYRGVLNLGWRVLSPV